MKYHLAALVPQRLVELIQLFNLIYLIGIVCLSVNKLIYLYLFEDDEVQNLESCVETDIDFQSVRSYSATPIGALGVALGTLGRAS